MSFLLKNTIHRSLVDSVYNEFLSRRSNYYYFIGKVVDWANTNSPDAPQATDSYEYSTRNSILTAKKINVGDVSYVVPRRNWSSGTVYDQYDGEYSASSPAQSGATNLKDATFYVLTGDFRVYKCLFNNNDGASTVEPFGTDIIPTTYNDGYVWKYLYTIPLSSRNRFLTDDYMPVTTAIENAFYSNGEISSVVISNSGSGYSNNAEVVLTVTGTFLGKPGNSIANLTPVFNDSGQFIDVIIKAQGNNYSNATITITDNLSSGTSFYNSVSNVSIYNIGTGYTPPVRNNTTITITTTGSSQPTANAKLAPIYSNNNNTLVGVTVIDGGVGYTTPVRNNTTLTIATTGSSQPTANASGNLNYSTAAILTPILLNGKIDRILINDPGTGYSANNQTQISIIGDGTGAVLLPVINDSGELQDVIIHQRGAGYTYADAEVVGNGSNANVQINLSTGDYNSLQGLVELSAVNGGIYALRVEDGGDGYTSANVAVYGDGSGFIGNVVRSNNTIDYITVTSPGSGFTFANVVITGPGSNANVTAILSPTGGHGKDAVKELFADTLMFYSTINNEKNHGVTVNNDYRQFGIIKDLRKFSLDQAFTSLTGSACYLVTLNTVSGLSSDEILTFTDDNNQKRLFEIVEIVSSTNQVLLVDKNNYSLQAEDVLQDTLLTNFTVVSVDNEPDINKFSGDLLYIDNRTTVSYSDQQLVTLRTIIQL